ncbi:outer membrane receptor protein involved in Fe transport [Povalibacter uvarum]|uniref:Outer membrane receptor protein involved in Fe transport n=1 Tax=Povalibacter uvarum TaxID=732238 RepID=A0A841HLK5_9GAMM|nr:TonB-dependent receptor [Povalibacter uvarum]MBB6093756.1 outer membrane receptor protein involved in Fe transport [Povalibacter uvarum]
MNEFKRLSQRIALGGSASALAMMMGTTNVLAADSTTIAEIVVTAQKRTEALIDIPQSITAIDGGILERQQAANFQDYLKLVPGLQLTQDTPGVGRLVMRGINTGGVASTVGVYVDETPFGSSSGLVNGAILAGDFDTFDMQRVEVLRGPQGTLYGASSLGGVLKFVTNPPQTQSFEARMRVGAETVEDGDTGYSGTGMVNIPLSDSFAVRGVGYYRELGGFVDSIGTAGSDVADDINGSESYGGRVSALYAPSDAFSLQLTAIMQNIRTDASSSVESDPETLDTLYGRLSQSQYVPEFRDVDYRLYNATLDWDLGFATLTSSTSYNEFDSPFRSDVTLLLSAAVEPIFGPNEGIQNQTTKYDKVTQELRLASNESDSFEWLAGVYYTEEKGDIIQHIGVVTPGTLDEIPMPPPFVPLFGDTVGDLLLQSEYEEIAAFVSGTIHFGSRFDLTLGGRYSENDQNARQDGVGLLAGGAAGVSFPAVDSSEDVFTYSVAPKFKINEHASLYARAATGFRPGGPNVLPPGAPPDVPTAYESDELTSYEVGLKVESDDRAYSLDVAVFHIDWEDIQVLGQVNDFGVNLNGGDATSEGLEFTAVAHLSDAFRVSLNGAYTDAQLEDDTPELSGGLEGDALPFTPEWSLGLNADYEWSIGAQSTAYVGGALRYLSDQIGSYDLDYRLANGRQREIPSYEVLDLQTGVDFGRFSIELYAKNVTDSDGRTSTGAVGSAPNGAIGTGVIRPRTIGLMFGVDF